MNIAKQQRQPAINDTSLDLPERWRDLPGHLAAMDRIVYRAERLFILGVLATNQEGVRFKHLVSLTRLTAGNLHAHMKPIEQAGYIVVQKYFEGRTPVTAYVITPAGRKALEEYLQHVEFLFGLIRDSAELQPFISAGK